MDFVVHPEKESQSARDEEEVVYVVVGEKNLCSAAAAARSLVCLSIIPIIGFGE